MARLESLPELCRRIQKHLEAAGAAGRQTAVNRHAGPRDIVGGFAEQKGGQSGQLLVTAETPGGNRLLPALLKFGRRNQLLPGSRRGKRPRSDGVDANAVAGPLDRQRAREG